MERPGQVDSAWPNVVIRLVPSPWAIRHLPESRGPSGSSTMGGRCHRPRGQLGV